MIADVGFFGTYLFGDGHWSVHKPDDLPVTAEPWLLVGIHDSDVATLVYRPAGPGSGIAYLGYTPRTYFEDPDASAPTDVATEAAGLASWWAEHVGGGVSDAALAAKAAELADFLAADIDPAGIDPADIDIGDDDEDDAEVFVEIKTAAFLAALALPVLEDLLD